MPSRRTVLGTLATATAAGLAGCGGGGNGNGETGDDEATAIGETIYEDDSEEALEVTHSPRFEEEEFSDIMFVEGEAENLTDDLRLFVEIAVETSFRLDQVTATETIDPGDTWEFEIEYTDVDSERLEEYDLTVSYTEPPETV